MVSKERLTNVAWTVGAVVVAMALYDTFLAPALAKFRT